MNKLLSFVLGEYGNKGKKYQAFAGMRGNWCGMLIYFCCYHVIYIPAILSCSKCPRLSFPEKFQVAREWLKIGRIVFKPKMGDLVVFWRESLFSWKGHVGIFIKEDEADSNYIWVLGGNQYFLGFRIVCIKKYKKSEVLGYRRVE